MIREICKAGWLQQKIEKRAGGVNKWTKTPKSIYLPEKWYVLCIHDDRFPFLEVYSNDEGVSRHEPLETLNLNECQYITTAIEDERTFVIAFQNGERSSLELAALSALERREWMDMLRFKLTRLGCLESGANIYSPFPVPAASSANTSVQEPLESNVPAPGSVASNEPAVPGARVEERSSVLLFSRSSTAEESVDHTYEPPLRSSLRQSSPDNSDDPTESMAPVVTRLPFNDGIYEPIAHVERSDSHSPTSENAEENANDSTVSSALPAPRYSVIRKEEKPVLPPRNFFGATWSNGPMEVTHRRQTSESSFYDVPRGLLSPTLAAPPPSPKPPIPSRSSIERYDPLPMESTIRRSIDETVPGDFADSINNNTATPESVSRKNSNGTPDIRKLSFDNPGFDEDEDSSRHYANGPLLASPDVEVKEDQRRCPYSSLSARTRMVPWQLLNMKPSNSTSATSNASSIVRAHSNSPSFSEASTSNQSRSRSVPMMQPLPSMAIAASSPSISMDEDQTPSPPTSPPPAPPLPPPNSSSMNIGNGHVKSLKEMEVERLHIEMDSELPVRAHVLLEHLVNENGHLMGLALVDMIGYVWIAGWLKRLTKQFSAGLHIGDRIDSIVDADGKAVAINSVAKAEQILKECWKRRRSQVSFLVKRLPLGQAYFLKRASNGESVGIVLKGGKNEILSIEDGKAAHKAGMVAQCRSKLSETMVNYFITEVNGRPLNIFAKDGQAQKRLSAVGTEITVLVQPSDFVKELRKKLKHKKGHKEYIIG